MKIIPSNIIRRTDAGDHVPRFIFTSLKPFEFGLSKAEFIRKAADQDESDVPIAAASRGFRANLTIQ